MNGTAKRQSGKPVARADRPSLNLEGRPYLNVQEAAHLLALSPWTIRQRVRMGALTCIRVGTRLLFDRADLTRFMEEQKQRVNLGPYPSTQQRRAQ